MSKSLFLNLFTSSLLFETFFVLWLSSYQFKNAHSIFQNPDITIVLTLILLPWAFRIGRREGISVKNFFDPPLVLFFLFSLWCVSSAFWSAGTHYARSKALCYVFYNIPAFLMAYFIVARTVKNITLFLKGLFFFSFFLHLYIFYVFWAEGVGIVNILNTNYLRTGQTIGIGFLISFIYSLYRIPSSLSEPFLNASYWLALFFCGTLFFVAINLGGRGPVISMGIAVFAIYLSLSHYKTLPGLLRHFIMLSLVILGVYVLSKIILLATTPAFFLRMKEAFNLATPDKNVTLRIDFYLSALKTFFQHPLIGVGFGGWPVVFGMGDILWHPHNLFLELLAETGGIGFLGFCGLLWTIFRKLSVKKVLKDQITCTLLALFIFSFTNAMKTGDLIDNIFLFVCLALLGRADKIYSPTLPSSP